MGRIVLNWLMSLILGSILIALFSGDSDSIFIAIIAIVLAALSSLPLLITELISCSVIRKRDSLRFDFKRFTYIKYTGVLFTLVVFQLLVGGNRSHISIDQFPSLYIFSIWGIPGLILHFLFLRPGLIKYSKAGLRMNDDPDTLDRDF